MTQNKAQKQSREIISNALSAASEILNLPNRSAQDMIDISQKLADRIIQAAKELSGATVKSAVKPQPGSVRTSKVFSISDIDDLNLGRRYEGKRITVWGEISDIGESKRGFDITLSENTYHDDYKIYCYFSSEWENAILSLKCGQSITVNGEIQYVDHLDENELLDCEILRDRIISTAQEASGVSVQPRSVSSSEVVSVASVFREYEENFITAKRKYEGRRITVQGKAYNIVGNEQELWFRLGEHYEDDEDDEDDDEDDDDYYLECYFLPEWESLIHTLKEGDTITVNGEWRLFKDSQADLHNCEIVIAE